MYITYTLFWVHGRMCCNTRCFAFGVCTTWCKMTWTQLMYRIHLRRLHTTLPAKYIDGIHINMYMEVASVRLCNWKPFFLSLCMSVCVCVCISLFLWLSKLAPWQHVQVRLFHFPPLINLFLLQRTLCHCATLIILRSQINRMSNSLLHAGVRRRDLRLQRLVASCQTFAVCIYHPVCYFIFYSLFECVWLITNIPRQPLAINGNLKQ